jgi:predicted metal-dependent phosphoesterase TrpH
MLSEKRIDLHMHSTFSDGILSPTELVEKAISKRLSAIALSDHDSIEGFGELSQAAASTDLEVMTGVELSCGHNDRDLHILGYGVAVDDASLNALLTKFRITREQRGVSIVKRLNEVGVDIDMAAVMAKAGHGSLGRPHIAEVLVETGVCADFNEVFAKYIGENGPAYVDKYKISPEDAVNAIHGAGGLAFVAHPGYYMEDISVFESLLDAGFDGIEVIHPHHNRKTVEQLRAIVERRGMLSSGGSDYHGFKGRDNMGDGDVPYELFERIQKQLSA